MQILELDDVVFDYYKLCTYGNESITKDQAARKLTRNVLMAMPVPPRNELDRLKGNQMYYFGNLHMVVRNGKVIFLHNHTGKGKHYGGWFKDEEKYIELTKQLGII